WKSNIGYYSKHYPHCETWWWQHYVVGMIFLSKDMEAGPELMERWMELNTINPGKKPVEGCKSLGRRFTIQQDKDQVNVQT
ncbi:MAG: hypothetical protein ACRC4N_05690, partial [Gammaproteobacteria bacterium]